MFESVIKGGGRRSGARLGKGALTAIAVHAVVIVLVVVFASSEGHTGQDKKKDHTEVTFVQNKPQPKPPPPPTTPPPPVAAAPAPPPSAAPVVTEVAPQPRKPRPKAKPQTVTVSDKAPPPPEPSTGPVNPDAAPGMGGGGPGGDPNGIRTEEPGNGPPAEVVPQNAVLPFGEGMNRPKRLEGRDPQYTREALEAHVEGTMIVRCVIETDGTVQDCKVIKPLPYMERAVLDAITSARYTPVTFQGNPVRVNYTFNIKLVLPQ